MSSYVVGRNYRRREAALGLAMVTPAFVFFSVFVIYPFARNFYLAAYLDPPYPGLPSKYVGFEQFWATISSSTFIDSLRSTAIFVGIIVPLGLLCGLTLALLAHQKLRGMAFYRTAFASSITSSVAVSAVVFGLFLNPTYGYLPWLHIHIIPQVTSNPTWALPALALIQVWQFSGVVFIILIAGLQSLPEEVLEAASIDGASSFSRLWRVTLPLLSNSIFVTILYATVVALQSFGQIDVLIGPASSANLHTNVLIYLVYQATNVNFNPGVAASYSLALFFIIAVVAVLQLQLRMRNTREAAGMRNG